MNFKNMSIEELEKMRAEMNEVLRDKRERAKNEAVIKFKNAFEELMKYVDAIVAVGDDDTEILIDDFNQFDFED